MKVSGNQKRISRRTLISLALTVLLIVTVPLAAQVFPEREHLDVIDLIDGSILVGVITEDEEPDPVRITLWSGTEFVVDRDNIERIRSAQNTGYGKGVETYVHGPVGEPGDPGGPPDDPSIGNGVIVGAYGVPFFPLQRRVGGSWEKDEDGLDDVEQEDSAWEFGGSLHFLSKPFGVRVGAVVFSRSSRLIGIDNSGHEGEFSESTSGFAIPVETLIGYGGDRFFWYGSAGLALVAGGTEQSVDDGPNPTTDPDSRFADTDRDGGGGIGAYAVVSVGTIIRLGQRWAAEARVVADRQLSNSYVNRRSYFQTVGFGFGFGYRLR